MTVVYGCFGCGGEENPEATFTMMYKDEEGAYQMHWLCRPCLQRFGDRVRLELTHLDRHKDAQEEFDGFSPTREVEVITQGLS